MRHKQITALLLSAIVAVSSCMSTGTQAFAAEDNAVEESVESVGQIPGDGQGSEEDQGSADTEESEGVIEPDAAAGAADAEGEPDQEAENAAADAAAEEAREGGEAQESGEARESEEPGQESGDESEDAAADATDEVARESEEETENVAADSTEAGVQGSEAGKTADESAAAATTKPAEQEDVYLPLTVEGGLVDETRKDATYASAAWDAEKLSSLPILDTDVSSASDGNILLGVPGEYIASQQAVLDRINEIRREACEEGVTNPETGKPLTMDDYVPLKWSRELEEIARIRAAEASITADHVRTNGESWQSMDSEYWYVGECVAWNYGKSATFGIEQWYDEKKYWLDGNSEDSGHYTTMIRPAMHHVGGSTFYSRYAEYPNTTLIEFYTEEGLDDSFVNMTGECIQTLEVKESSLNGDPSIMGTFSGVKGDEQKLYLTTDARYSGYFTANTKGLLFMDGVSWSSSNSKIASVSSDGTAKAVKCGSATITATAENGSSATSEFTVNHVLQKIPAVDATCTATGLTEGEKCANCGTITVKQETVPAKGHSYGSWTVTKKATCTTAGSRKKTCSACGNVVTESIPATGHTWETEYTVDKAATCTTDGSKSIHCSVCDAIKEGSSVTISKTGHSYGSWKVTKKATCTEKGSRERVCTKCGYKVTQAIAATGHTWETEYTVDTAATCTKEGSKSIHCSVCDAIDSSTVQAIPMIAHKYGKWTVTKEPTCTEKGSKVRTCTVCGKKQTKAIPVLTPGWKQDANGWKYLRPNTTYPKSQFEVIDGYTYYFNDSEYRVTGLQEIEGAKYYFNDEGVMQTGWQTIEEAKYYFGEDGAMQTGWQTIDGDKYYFEMSGKMHTGWLKKDGEWYFFKVSGVMHTGWLKKGGIYYYFRTDGRRLTGWLKKSGKLYYFKTNGAMLTGWLKKSGRLYYFKTNGQMHTGWLRLSGRYYYFKPENGQMVTGRYQIGGKWYTFDSNGVRQ